MVHKVRPETEGNSKKKRAVEADLGEAKGDLDDANDLVKRQALATNIWQVLES